jgi:hypothetical protein
MEEATATATIYPTEDTHGPGITLVFGLLLIASAGGYLAAEPGASPR